jgi:hypothetical protein
VRRFLNSNGLSLAMFALFIATLLGMSMAGQRVYNAEQRDHDEPTIGYIEYLATDAFIEVTFENWESEFLQMAAYVLLTVSLFQRGSAESKDPGKSEDVDEDPRGHRNDPGAPWPVRRGGFVLMLYENSLFLAFALLFLISFVLHALGGAGEFSDEQIAHGESGVSLLQYFGTSQFWFESLQNRQSEFLAVGAIVVLSVFLRQRGSPESKPVAMPHSQTKG